MNNNPTEHAEQAAVCLWLQYAHPDVLFWATPNGASLGGKQNQRYGQVNKLKAEGMLPGVADIIIAESCGGYHACGLEMKSLTGKLSENQEWFLAQLRERGWYTIVAHGADEAIAELAKYLSWTRRDDEAKTNVT
jgi:hypothetical protein